LGGVGSGGFFTRLCGWPGLAGTAGVEWVGVAGRVSERRLGRAHKWAVRGLGRHCLTGRAHEGWGVPTERRLSFWV